jgi:DNA-binding PadR family transcriptional regulator
MHNHTHHTQHRQRCGGPRGFGRRGGFGPGRGLGGDTGFGDRQGRGGRRRLFDAEALRLVLLRLIADEPRHGYELIRAIEELTGGTYAPSPGVVYPTLSLLAELGQIAETEAEGARKRFAATPEGLAHLETNAEAADAAMARLAALAGPADRVDPAPLKRAMANLGAVLEAQLRQEGVDRTRLLEIAALVDEAASKIERL